MPAVTVVEVRGLRKEYDGRPALDGVDLSLAAGEVHGLVGPNGAGKTTLLRVLLGLVAADAGTATVLDAPVAPGRTGIAGFVEAPAFYPFLTGRANLALLQRLDDRRDQHEVDDVLEQVGLAEAAGTKVGGWSTGMRQRLGLAGALLRRPQVLVLDEPTSALDPVAVARTHALLRDLAAAGTAVLLSSHGLSDVAALCSRVTVLAGGTVRYAGTTADLEAALPPAVQLVRTSDDAGAAAVLAGRGLATVEAHEEGLRVLAHDLDAVVLALADEGIAVRRLVEESDTLTRAFLELTA